MNTHKVGLTLGAFAGLLHLIWEALIFLGWAQGYISFILGLHSLSNPYTVQAFDLAHAVELVVLACIVGYIVGAVFAVIFNKFHK